MTVSSVASNSVVNRPYRQAAQSRRKPQIKQAHKEWRNSDNPLAARSIPKMTTVQIVEAPSPRVERVQQAKQPTVKKPSLIKRGVITAGAFMATFGVAAGFLSTIALGAVGVAVAIGAALIGAALLYLGKRMK
jgi:hypothetical protein